MILFKEGLDQREISRISPKLRRIVEVYAYLAKVLYDDDIVITEIFRNDPKSVHQYGRGVDIAILERGKVQGSEHLRKTINVLFPYRGGEWETIPSLNHGTAPHTHIQVAA